VVSDFNRDKGLLRRRFGVLASYVPELVAIHHGLRTSLQVTLPLDALSAEQPRLERFCNKAGLALEIHRRGDAAKAVISRDGLGVVPDGGTARAAGQWFSYPACCVAAYTSQGPRQTGDDFVNRMTELVRQAPSILDFRLNPFLRTSPFHLYKHFPCSLDCQATAEKGEEIRLLLARTQPELHAGLLRYGASPVLFLDVCGKGISLDGGRVDGNRVTYRQAFVDGDPTAQLHRSQRDSEPWVERFREVLASVSTGDELQLRERELVVRRDGQVLGGVQQPPDRLWRILDFDEVPV